MKPDIPDSSNIISRLHAVISPIWEHFLNDPARYIDTLLYDRVIDFRGSFIKASTINLFSTHIYPSLREIAAIPSEKALLTSVIGLLKTNDLFLSIIPIKTDKQSSCAYFTVQGLGMSQMNTGDSCTIEMQYGDEVMRLLSDKDHTWHLGTTDNRSTLLHELAHIDNMLQGDYLSYLKLLTTSSWRWTNEEEYRVIHVENCALEGRGLMQRLGHKALPFTNREFANMPSTLKLAHALALGADSTVKELCDRHLAASEESVDRIIFNSTEHAHPYAAMFLVDHPDEDDIVDNVVDIEFQQATRAHKRLAIIHLIRMLEQTENGLNLIKALLESIVTKATTQQRSDVIPFIHGLQHLYE